jgi:UDP-N-acetyl-D-mannosaminuronate dehydrogenase
VDALAAAGAEIVVHDPCVQTWPERPAVPFTTDLMPALAAAEAVVLAIPHGIYRRLTPADFAPPKLIVDANNVLADDTAAALHAAGSRVVGVGKGHWRKRGFHS